jgi:hypothetical protein
VSENAITPFTRGLCRALIVSTTFGPMRGRTGHVANCGEGHQNLDQASNQVERLALCCVVPPWEEGYGRQNIGPQVPSFRSTEGGMQWRQKYKIPDHRLNQVFGHYGPPSLVEPY